jgi:ATP-dependent DNA helicase RecG
MTVAAPTQEVSPLRRPVTSLFGVGPERAAQLARLEIFTVDDLLLHRPRRYEDRRHFSTIKNLQAKESMAARGKVVALGVKWFNRHTKSVFELVLDDGSARLHCRWWNLPFMEKNFAVGDEVFVFGKVLQVKPRTMDHPETEIIEGGEESSIHLNRIAPIYPLTEGLPQRWLRSHIWQALELYGAKIEEPWQSEMLQVAGCKLQVQQEVAQHPLTGSAFGFIPTRREAIRALHFPEALEDTDRARRRLALDEFVELQRQIQARRRNFETKAKALPCHGDNRLMKPFLARLGFKLTEAQTKVLRELRQDMSGEHPMRRLLQGDVGSGKTVVAACCALMAIESGYDVALMAPTEILAEQHFQNFRKWLEPLGIKVAVQTGSCKSVQSPTSFVKGTSEVKKSEVQRPGPTATNHRSLTIGTHALIESGFTPENLGLVIIDEQHRFGVAQREKLLRKGRYPHLLVMTATPIPRTLGLTVYGELDVSVMGGFPPGRGTIKTFVRMADKLPQVWEFMLGKLKAGRQAYVVYPRVEESGPNGIKAVTSEFEKLRKTLHPHRVGLIHGNLRSKDKEEVMNAFRTNSVQVLLATSLIEVGVDVPNATIMLIENAEQFGLAQLHQLRGRIGRGTHDAFCILIAAAKSKESRERLRVLEQTNDGFEIAEADLKMRGPGELLGHQQSGLPKFRFGDLATDWDLIQQARRIAARLSVSEIR